MLFFPLFLPVPPFEDAGDCLQEYAGGDEHSCIGQQDGSPWKGYGDAVQVVYLHIQAYQPAAFLYQA